MDSIIMLNFVLPLLPQLKIYSRVYVPWGVNYIQDYNKALHADSVRLIFFFNNKKKKK